LTWPERLETTAILASGIYTLGRLFHLQAKRSRLRKQHLRESARWVRLVRGSLRSGR
jgi:hypothetical protein